jgi:ribosome modulation factor
MIEKKNAFEKGRNAFKAGISDKSTPYNMNDTTHLFWLQGWRQERRRYVKKFRKEHKEDIKRSFQHLKERYEADWIKYTRASNGNIFTQRLNYLKARKIINNIRKDLDISPEVKLLKKAGYGLIGGPDPFRLYDKLDREDGLGITLNTNKRKASHKREAFQIGNRVYFISVILLIFFSVVVGLYLIKTRLGLDLIPGVHVGRYLGL